MQAVFERDVGLSELEVYHAGELTVLGFGGRAVMHDFNMARYRDEVADLVRQHRCRAMAFDLTGVWTLPSGFTGVLTCLIRQGLEVHLFNACDDIRESLELVGLDRLLHLHELKI